MKSALTLVLLLSLAGISVFGYLAISHGDGMAHGGCIAEMVSRTGACSLGGGFLSLANFHLNALKSFSLAIFISVLALASVSAVLAISFADVFYSSPIFYYFKRQSEFFSSVIKSFFSDWLSLRENSPSLT